MLRELSLFTGYAGFTLGLRLAGIPLRTVLYVEIDRHRQEIIKARIHDGMLDDAPICDDIRTLRGEDFRGLVDIVTAGFPCQPHSICGRRLGAADARNLWPETARLVGEVRPPYVFLENVRGLAQRSRTLPAYAYTVLADLADMGYDAVWGIVAAADAGAPHLRKRWWCLAWHTDGGRLQKKDKGIIMEKGQAAYSHGDDTFPHAAGDEEFGRGGSHLVKAKGRRQGLNAAFGFSSPDVAHAAEEGRQNAQGSRQDAGITGVAAACAGDWWAVEPGVGRVAHGVAARVDRLRALGDGLVPAVVADFLGRIGWTR